MTETWSHVQRVRVLYKTILKLQRGLPEPMKSLGDTYVKDEFRRNKSANSDQIPVFMEAWTTYAMQLTQQMGPRGLKTGGKIGQNMDKANIDCFTTEQLMQLYELYLETSKPKPEKKS